MLVNLNFNLNVFSYHLLDRRPFHSRSSSRLHSLFHSTTTILSFTIIYVPFRALLSRVDGWSFIACLDLSLLVSKLSPWITWLVIVLDQHLCVAIFIHIVDCHLSNPHLQLSTPSSMRSTASSFSVLHFTDIHCSSNIRTPRFPRHSNLFLWFLSKLYLIVQPAILHTFSSCSKCYINPGACNHARLKWGSHPHLEIVSTPCLARPKHVSSLRPGVHIRENQLKDSLFMISFTL